jgi:ATPase subunit of ABC transporter with duplicated ATPase domains
MKFRIALACIFFGVIIASSVCAQKVYFWKDEKGVMNATTTPPPDNIKQHETDSWGKPDSPAEIQRYHAGEKAKEQRRDAELRQRQQANRAQEEANRMASQVRQSQEESQKNIQRSRDERADKVESDTRERLRAVSGMGFNLPSENRNAIEKAAAAKADQIRKGTDTPMSEREDIEFHMQQKINALENEVRSKTY